MPTSERVLCIPRSQLVSAGEFHGFRRFDEAFATALLNAAGFSFRPRSEVETDPNYKQLIPYVVLRYGDTVFHYRRGGSGTRMAFGRGDGYRCRGSAEFLRSARHCEPASASPPRAKMRRWRASR